MKLKMPSHHNFLLGIATFVFLQVALISAQGQLTVFSDNFTTSQGTTYTESGLIGTSPWTVSRSGVDFGGRIDSGIMTLTNDATATANVNGWVFASAATANFTAPFTTTLSANTGVVTWEFNMRQIRTDPAGFGSTSYGVAYILAGTSTTAATAGQGYAIVLGQSGGTDAIRLVTYNNGIQGTLTNIITATGALTDVGLEYMSLRVTYDPATDLWSLFGRSDGTTSFADPSTGELTSLGTVTNSTYVEAALDYMGGYWQGSTAGSQTAFFDNVKVIVTPPVAAPALYWDSNGVTAGAGATPTGTWGVDTFWSSSALGDAVTTGWTASEDAVFAAGEDAINPYTVSLSGAQSADKITFEEGQVTLSGDALIMTGTLPTLTVTADQVIISSQIQGAAGLRKNGPGLLRLTAANSYVGNTDVVFGTVEIAANAALGNDDNDLTLNGTLRVTAPVILPSTRFLTGAGAISVESGDSLEVLGPVSMTTLTLADSGTVDFDNASVSVGSLGLSAASTVMGSELTLTGISATHTTGSATIENGLNLSGASRTVTVSSASATLNLEGDITLAGSTLNKQGAGTLVLTGNNTALNRLGIGSQGATPVDGGKVVISSKTAIGTQTTNLNYGTLEATVDLVSVENALDTGLSMGGRVATPAILRGGDMTFKGASNLFVAGGSANGDICLNVFNHTTFSGAFTSAVSSAALTGFAVGGDGKLTLSGSMSGFLTALKLKDTATVELDTDNISAISSPADIITLSAGTTLVIGKEGTARTVTAVSGLNGPANSVLKFDIGGTTRGVGADVTTGYDALVLAAPTSTAAGAITFAGKIDVDVIGDFVLAIGQTFDLLDWDASVTPDFTGIDFSLLPTLDPSMAWNTGSFTTNGTISIVSTAIVITNEPDSVSVDPGTEVTFTVEATGPGQLGYQWFKGDDAIDGETLASYTIDSVVEADQGNYRVRVSVGEVSTFSAVAVLDVIDPVVPVMITEQPQSLIVNAGTPATFTVTATGTPTLNYQWRKGIENIEGANSASYTIPAAEEANEGAYNVVVTGPGLNNSETSQTATLTVLNPGDPVVLTGTSYSTNFDGIAGGLPGGWTVRTGATISSLGNTATFTSTSDADTLRWANTGAGFRNYASATGVTGLENSAAQAALTNRAVGVRQTGSFGEPGASFNFYFSSAAKTLTSLSLKLQMLSVQTRSTTWSLQVGVGEAPEAWETLQTFEDPGVFGTTTVTIPEEQLVALANQERVWFRVVALAGSVGSGSRDTFAIDDFSMTYEDFDFGLFWDANGLVTGSGGPAPSGIWGTDNYWSASILGEEATAAWVPGQAATFSAGEDATGVYSITLAGAQSTRQLTFEEGEVTLSGDPLVMTGSSSVIDVLAPLAIIGSELQGTSGFRKIGDGLLRLTAANTVTGTVNVTGGTLEISADSALGNVDNDLVINGTLLTTASLTLPAGRSITGGGTLSVPELTTLTIQGSLAMSALTLADTGTVVLEGTGNSIGLLTLPAASTLQGTSISSSGIEFSAAGADAVIDNALDFGTTTKIITVPDEDSTLTLNGALTFQGTGNTSVQKFGLGALKLTGENQNLLRIQLGSQTTNPPSSGGRLIISDKLALGPGAGGALFFFNFGTLEAEVPLIGDDALPIGISLNSREDSKSVLTGEAIEFDGDSSFANFGAAGDVWLEVDNHTTLSGNLSGDASVGVTGFSVGGTGKLTLSGNLQDFKMPLRLQENVTVELNATGQFNSINEFTGTAHEVISLSSATTLAVSTIGTTGSVTAYTSIDAQSGSAIHFDIGGSLPGDAASGYDVLSFVKVDSPSAPAPTYTFGGVIEVELIGGFAPALGDTFDLLNWDAGTTPNFTGITFDLPTLAGGLVWSFSNFATDGTIKVVAPEIVIVDEIDSAQVNPGASVTFTVVAEGPGVLNYEWRKGTEVLPSVTGPSLTINPVMEADEGTYSVTVSSGSITATSTATLVVNDPITLVTATRSPSSTPLYVGESVTFTATSNGSGTFSYQWYKGDDMIEGADEATYVINPLSLADTALNYRVSVSNGGTPVFSNLVPLTVVDSLVVIASEPTPETIVGVGQTLLLRVEATGRPPLKYQWKKDGKNIGGATFPIYRLAAAAATSGGVYTCEVSNGTTNPISSAQAKVGVVQVKPVVLNLAVGAKVTMKTTVSGPVTFDWVKDGGALPGDFVTSADKKTLTGSALDTADSGTYSVQVTLGSLAFTGATHVLNVFDKEPTSPETVVMPDGIVGATYTFTMPIDTATPASSNAPSSYTAPGLPKGLKMDPKTGVISGRPTVASAIVNSAPVPFTVVMIAKNPLGSTITTGSLIIKTAPDKLAGVYAGSIGRSSDINGNLGGRMDLTLTATGGYTGSVTLGITKYTIKGFVEVDPETPDAADTPTSFSISVPRKGNPIPLQIDMELPLDEITEERLLVGTISDELDSVDVEGWRNKWNVKLGSPATEFEHYYTFRTELSDSELIGDDSVPQGSGYGSFKVAADGRLTIAGFTGDGQKLTVGGFVGPDGGIVVYQTLYTPIKGSIAGLLDIQPGATNAGADNTLEGALTLLRPANVKSRAYPLGFGPLGLIVQGEAYTPTLGRVALNLVAGSSAGLEFTDGGLLTSTADVTVRIDAKDKTVVTAPFPSPTLTKFTSLKSATGLFGGSFVLVDDNPLGVKPPTIKRTSKFQGIIVREGGESGVYRGYGYFLLDALPTVTPPTTTKTSPTFSGHVLFEQ